jgi:hypothetical protein
MKCEVKAAKPTKTVSKTKLVQAPKTILLFLSTLKNILGPHY